MSEPKLTFAESAGNFFGGLLPVIAIVIVALIFAGDIEAMKQVVQDIKQIEQPQGYFSGTVVGVRNYKLDEPEVIGREKGHAQ